MLQIFHWRDIEVFVLNIGESTKSMRMCLTVSGHCDKLYIPVGHFLITDDCESTVSDQYVVCWL